MKFFLLYYSIIFATSLTANTIWIHQNKNAQIPTNLKTRFEYWQSIYNNYIYTPHCDYYDFSKDPYHNKDKQDALKTLVAHQLCYDNKNNKFFSENNLNLLLTKALIVTNQDKEQTFTAIAQKVPCYNGTNENWRNLYSTEALSKFRELLYHNVTYDNNTETKFLQSSPIVFPASITPCWSWDKDSQQLVKKENIGIIFCNGVNFETQNTADYKTFNNNIDKLKEHINTIALCMITAAYQLTHNENKKTCNLKIPKIGLGCFAKEYKDIKTLTNLYLTGIKKALESEQYNNIDWDIEFFNFENDSKYKTEYNTIFKYFNFSNNIKHNHIINTSIFTKTKDIDSDTTLTVIAHAGDQHAFLGNGCYNDPSLERCLTGYSNDYYLTLIHLLNLFLPEILNDAEIKEITINDQDNKIDIGSLENSTNKINQRNTDNRIRWIGVSAFAAIFVGVFLYLKREKLNNFIHQISSYFDNATKI